MDAWHRTGAAEMRRPACDRRAPLPERTWEDDHLAFAHLGFELWENCGCVAVVGWRFS
ncbi:hypothetical protein [Streptomyces avermitilis]|uniref:Uncharacterized protein n=1 Tax=Streptomyces avermitilis TaxID=33903 RepID=A0A4D4M958_STRAX|nr:hypothetical protein [Streptomyces avermitilis]GDY68460.1 hypothetical protein SAV14893_078530 [Streptomyces avermitilis]GDY71166.1 hypothetical protein SAV31267_006510 [Streptomyces avermitilis]